MRYDVTFGVDGEGAPVAVELVEKPDGRVEATVDGREVAIDVAPIEALGLSSVLVDAQVVDLALEAGGLDEIVVFASGERLSARVRDLRFRGEPLPSAHAPAGVEALVRSPMPGRVVKVLVARGERVEAQQGLVVLEAMKMENEVRAVTAGTVTEVFVTAGAAVESGAKLVSIARGVPA